MTLRELSINWRKFALVDEDDVPLTVFLKECLGEHKGGLLFMGCGEEEGNTWILKVDDLDGCFRKIGDSGDDEQDWQLIGTLVRQE